jgi:hypothetical protein
MAIIDKPTDHFNTILYTGTGASLANTGVGFQPDFTWIKGRSGATEHVLTDSVRGVTIELSSNDTGADETVAQGLTAFGTDGFTVGTDGSYNTSSATYASWNFKAGGTAVSNTVGDIASQVSANTTSGFSIVSYTGTGATATVGHGLGVTPKMFIVKNRSITETWRPYHVALGGGQALALNGTNATDTDASYWSNTNPTSSVFTVGTNTGTNGSGNSMIAYCFAEVKGYSKFGSYTGNGSADGTFVYTGFKPAFVMVKRTDNSGNWWIHDSGRNTYNVVNKYLFADSSSAEGTDDNMDFLSNGFKLRVATYQPNTSGGTWIYLAIAEQPFVTSTTNGSIPATAR